MVSSDQDTTTEPKSLTKPVYYIGAYDIDNPVHFKPYTAVVGALLPKYGGKVLATDTSAYALEGRPRTMNAIVRFPSREAAVGLYNDPDYQEAKRIRHVSTSNCTMVLVEEFDSTSFAGAADSTQILSATMTALAAAQPNPRLASKLLLYGQFVGSWEADIDFHALDGSRHWSAVGEIHFDWVLQGTAIQDLFIIPKRSLRNPGQTPEPWHRYGSTFRWYDPRIDAWHVTFFDPLRSVEMHQIGRQVGNDIVQIGDDAAGFTRRWRFTEITVRSFTWLGDVSWDRGATWTLELEMRARRVGVGAE
jgi:uncharacterized protein (DUF1330 family)